MLSMPSMGILFHRYGFISMLPGFVEKMEEVGEQVASSILDRGGLLSKFCQSPLLARKRDYPCNQVRSLNCQPQELQQPLDSGATWRPNSWHWDSIKFVATPVESEILQLSSVNLEQNKRGEEGASTSKSSATCGGNDESLGLNLGGRLKMLEEPVSRPSKRVRSGSPGSNSPICQVDGCSEDLLNGKDYHRRHKVCEVHSKASKALVGKQMQRFCQQCSRFHPLPEFDEGKRSCRRRLAGHNRRRRKTQGEDAGSRILSPSTNDAKSDAILDMVNLLTAFSSAQGKIDDKSIDSSHLPNKDEIRHILGKINALVLATDLKAKLSSFGSLNGTSSRQGAVENSNKLNGTMSSPSATDFLTVLSATLLSRKNGQIVEMERSKMNNFFDQSADPKGPIIEFNSVGGERSSSSCHTPVDDSDCHAMETQANLPLQLFGSSPDNCSPRNLPSSRKYFSSGGSNRTEDRSPCSSKEGARPEISITMEVNENARMNTDPAEIVPLDLFRDYDKESRQGQCQIWPYQSGHPSSSGSDLSPSSLRLGTKEHTGRIMFKLFDKDPSHFPKALRSQIYSWLSSSPLEMESYIRPGCLVLSLYISMPSSDWEQLEQKLLERLERLVHGSESNFWKSGRFLVQIGQKFAFHSDGNIRILKSWRTSPPQLISVSPLALAVGQENTQLALQGRNLVNHGTRIHCSYMGGYISKEVAELSCEKSGYDEIRIKNSGFDAMVAMPPSLGRCFIEVENGFGGNSFPLIIADATICSELRMLESELMEEKNSSREEVLHFLNELGWLFQRRNGYPPPADLNYSLGRFKFLFIFTVERDWCCLMRKLLDILAEEINFDESLPVKESSFEALTEVQVLNRAVRRGSTKMVELLINYAINCGPEASRTYIFPPNMRGSGGITPLHLAACTSGSTGVVDALTNDPQEIGLNSWSTLLDACGQSASSYAAMRNYHAYNELVARKISDRRNGQISLSMDGFETRESNSCARCSMEATKHYGTRTTRSQGVLHRPYMYSMLTIAAVCVCVCLFFRGAPKVGLVAPFKWENLDYGPL
ncbi:hypothetical protein SAY86_016285 [Trapa natans]|uniref:SBP-type domain-containing protein n=1 Tax=Trapa natans TaxID=22666 RepID=A0AAN7LFT3_TRANT|nr:hypothetical protein SAY86_016285 [Trapa natans]